ncbi:MAG: hypothetical protein WCS87_16465 [Methylococcaceae bacterium]
MTLRIIPETLNGYCEVATGFTIFAEVENDSNKAIVIDTFLNPITISIKNNTGMLLLVEEADYINGTARTSCTLKIPAQARKNVKMVFRIPSVLYDEVMSSHETFILEIGEASISVSRETNSMLSLPKGPKL